MEKLTPILPCRSRGAVSDPRSPAQADELLAACTALWHPAVVAAARAMPRWTPATLPPDDPTGHLLLIPPTAEPLVSDSWWEHAEQLGAQWIRGKSSRSAMVAAALALLESPRPASGCPVDPELVADFLALGYCHFVIETITSESSYMNSLDEGAVERELVAAAVAACGGDDKEARDRLQAAFDVLHTARESYYSAGSHLLDLTLVAGSTLGQSLRSRLAVAPGDAPCNLLLSAEVLEQMAAREPTTLDALRSALQQGAASIVGGEYRELELPLLPLEAVRSQIVKGLSVYEQYLAVRPTIFGRRRFGMTPLLPQILDNLGFSGVFHATLDDGRFPAAGASRQRWEGIDGTMIEMLSRVPIDASKAEGFLRLPRAISGATDMDYNPTAVFAYWPGRTSCWHEDIERILRYTTALGKFRLLPDYFEHTGFSAYQAKHKPDEYCSPYLAQTVAADEKDPISRWPRYYAEFAAAEAAGTITNVCGTLRAPDTLTEEQALTNDAALAASAAGFAQAVGAKCDPRHVGLSNLTVAKTQAGKPDVLAAPAGLMVINPLSFSRRVCVDVNALAALPDIVGPVLHAGETAGRKSVIVEVPPLGFAMVRPGTEANARQSRRKFGFFLKSGPKSPSLAQLNSKQGAILRNEFFEVVIDAQLGAIRGIYDFRSRGPRLAQQIAMRLHGGEGDDAYSIMAADEIRVNDTGPVVGEVAARGRLLERTGQLIAEFQQTTRVVWGSRVIEVEVEIDPRRQLDSDPWNSYCAARFAWANDTPTVYRSVNQATVASEATRLEAPQFIEIRAESGRTTILSAGLPYHRRCGLRKLDSLLIVRGETARRFRFGIGIDLPQPQAAALDFDAPTPVVPVETTPKSDSAWLYHLDNRGVVATHWELISENGAVKGVRVRLLETEGRQVSLVLRSFRTVHSAQKVGAANRAAEDLSVAGDRVTVSLRPYEWAEVEMR